MTEHAIEELVRRAYNDGFAEGVKEHSTRRGGTPWSDYPASRKRLEAYLSTLEPAEAKSDLPENSSVWKWVERLAFDRRQRKEDVIDILLHHPSAPWNRGGVVWDVTHLDYADDFYKKFPASRPHPESTK